MELQELKSELKALAEKHGASNELLNELAACTTKQATTRTVIKHRNWLIRKLPMPELYRIVPVIFVRLNAKVRKAVAGNPNCPADLLVELAEDPDWWVRHDVAENPSCPTDLLTKLANDTLYWVRGAVAKNPDCPAETLTKLADDPHWWVREVLAKNPNCPTKTLAKLSNDPHWQVSEAARNNPNYKTT